MWVEKSLFAGSRGQQDKLFCNFQFVEQDLFLAGGLIILHSCHPIACYIAEDVVGGQ